MSGMKFGHHSRRFIGLRWKSFLWLSLLLICMCSVFYALSFHSMMNQFEARQQAEINSLRHHVEGLFAGTSNRLIRLGGALATMSDLGGALTEGRTERLTEIVSDYAGLGYELDLRQIQLYTAEAALVGSWTPYGEERLTANFYRDVIDDVREEESPVTLLECQPLCLLHAFVPVLASGENVGVVSIGQSIADFIIEFKMVTGADIALAVPSDGNGGAKLSDWSIRIPAMTDAEQLMPLLRHLSKHFPDPEALDQGRMIAWNKAHYDVHRIQLDKFINGHAGFVLLISDVSQRLRDIDKTLRQTLLATIASLIAAELILLYLIHAPLQRLGGLASTLPLLAEGDFDKARNHFSTHSSSGRFRDEIDFLYESALSLSHQLEENSLSLAAKNKELAEERDFIQGLLEAAQVLVVTQTKQGVIRVGNDFAAQFIGFTPDQLYGHNFVDLIADADARRDVLKKLQALCHSGQRRMEHEHDLISGSGERRKVVWVHTPLREVHNDGTALLSVGLDITERVRAESEMRWLANHDPLTALVNRHRFIEDLTHSYDEAVRTGSTAALLVFDLDHFKEINDTSGHAAGDALLRMIADELKTRSRNSDIVARLGGDEFAMLMPNTDLYGAETFAKQLNERLAGTPFVYGEKRYRVGASIGIAFLPQHGADVQEVMANADLAMFEAKRAGRSRARVFSGADEQSQMLTQNIYWKDVLIQAMESEQLFFYFQPVVELVTGRTVYCEALLRMRDAEGRIVAPGEFLPSAERSGLSFNLDCYVVQLALKELMNNPDMRLSVNLSSAALNDSGWTEPLVQAARQRRLEPGRLVFEITETAVIADMDKAKKIVQDMTALGFRFAVDDFGAGFSSLYYLKHLPVDFVKIDQSLIKEIVDSEQGYDFVRAIVSMVHVFGKKVVGEGVENQATLDALKRMKVDLVQGYHIRAPKADFEEDLIEIGASE